MPEVRTPRLCAKSGGSAGVVSASRLSFIFQILPVKFLHPILRSKIQVRELVVPQLS